MKTQWPPTDATIHAWLDELDGACDEQLAGGAALSAEEAAVLEALIDAGSLTIPELVEKLEADYARAPTTDDVLRVHARHLHARG